MKRKSGLQDLTRAASDFFDELDEAHGDLEGTLDVLTKLIDHNVECDAGVIVTMERHFRADLAILGAVIAKSRKVILMRPAMVEPVSTSSSPVTLAVDNDGGDHAA